MKLKHVLPLLIALFCSTTIRAQEIKLKKGLVYVDGEPRFEYERHAAGNEMSVYTMGKETEILYFAKKNNETPAYAPDDFKQITFVSEKVNLETASYNGYPNKLFIEKLIREKAMDLDGNFDPEKLEMFMTKYDENITNRTIRY